MKEKFYFSGSESAIKKSRIEQKDCLVELKKMQRRINRLNREAYELYMAMRDTSWCKEETLSRMETVGLCSEDAQRCLGRLVTHLASVNENVEEGEYV